MGLNTTFIYIFDDYKITVNKLRAAVIQFCEQNNLDKFDLLREESFLSSLSKPLCGSKGNIRVIGGKYNYSIKQNHGNFARHLSLALDRKIIFLFMDENDEEPTIQTFINGGTPQEHTEKLREELRELQKFKEEKNVSR